MEESSGQREVLTSAEMQKEDVQAEAWGDRQTKKKKYTFRLLLQNIQRLPLSARESKHEDILNWIFTDEADAVILTEVNTYWPNVKPHQQWNERTKGRIPQGEKHRFAHNRHGSPPGTMQYGGVGALALGETRHRLCGTGEDLTGLGRWVWMRYKGKGEHHLRVVGAYRPNPKGTGENTVHAQHQKYLLQQEDTRDPQVAFNQDLAKQIKKWTLMGDQIIVALDANDDLRDGSVKRMMARQGLREALLTQHKSIPTVPTFHMNSDGKPIDGIFVTRGITLQAGGYYAFHETVQSPHRALWIDISFEDAFGCKLQTSTPVAARRLHLKDPRVVNKYNKILEKELQRLRLPQRLFLLETKVRAGVITEAQAKEYEAVHVAGLHCKAHAERKCRKMKMGGVDWSPAYQQSRDAIELWALLRRKKLGMKVSSRRLRRWIRKTKAVNPWGRSLEEIEEELYTARTKYRAAKKEASKLRAEHNDRLYAAMAEKQGVTVLQLRKNLNQIERLRKKARRVRWALEKLKAGGVTQVEVVDDDEIITHTSKAGIEKACAEENEQRFRGAYGRCAFLEEPMLSDFGSLGITDQAGAVLEGRYETPSCLPKWMDTYLNALRMPPQIRRKGLIPDTVSTDNHRRYWRRSMETTASEPRGLHNGHYKAGAESELVSQFDAALRNIPYHTGYAPQTWCNITDLAIEKARGVFLAHKMRTIQLMAAEYNTNNKQLGRDMMHHAESCKVLPEEHGGSRKDRQAAEQVLNKRLAMDITRQTRRAMGMAGTDAKSCYDRMAHTPTSLSMQRLGVPKGPIASLFGVLQKSIHRIRTAYGDSEVLFTSTPADPIQGIGQGNGCGPAGWVALSGPIMEMLRTLGFGLWALSTISCCLFYAMGFAFVDDTDLFHSGRDLYSTGESVQQEMQQAVDWWDRGITATGGSLVPEKSYWGLLDHTWDPSSAKWTLKSVEQSPGELQIRMVDSEDLVTLKRVEPGEAVKTLGVMLNMEGTDEAQAFYLRQKGEEWAELIRSGRITKNDAWYALNTTIMKTFEYPMAAICLSQSQWDHVMAPVLEAGLNAMQFSCKFPHDMVYGPVNSQGLGVKDPYVLQGLTWLKTLLRHRDRATVTGLLIRQSMELLHLEIGTGNPLFQDDFATFKSLATDCWLKHVWSFQQELELSLQHATPVLTLQSTSDLFLMSLFADAGFTGESLRVLNQCRRFLRATTVADLVRANGDQLCEDAWWGRRNDSRRSSYQWPRTERPANKHWNLWRRALASSLNLGRARQLGNNIGEWLPATRQSWQWWTDADGSLFHKEGVVWVAWTSPSASRLRSSSRSFAPGHIVSSLPSYLQPVSVRRLLTSRMVRITGMAKFQSESIPTTPTTLSEWRHHLNLTEPHDAWILDELEVSGSCWDVATSIEKGTARAVSDGSFKDSAGAAAFCIVSPETGSYVQGCHTVQGPGKSQSAYRSELSGILGIQHLATLLTKRYQLTTGSIELACDGLSALQQSFFHGPAVPTRPQFDYLQVIRKNFTASPLNWKGRHVSGHQDKWKSHDELDWWEQTNVCMDLRAKSKMLRPSLSPSHRISGQEGWSLWLHDHKYTSFDMNWIYTRACEGRVKAYWLRKGRLTDASSRLVAKDVLAAACQAESPGIRRWVTKHVTGVCGVGKWLERWQWQNHSRCPRCDASGEDHRHVYQCPSRSARIAWQASMNDLRTWCEQHNTDPAMLEVMLSCLLAWGNGQALPPYFGRDRLAAAYDDQRRIGWGCFLEGSIAHTWLPVQAAYLSSLGSRKTAKTWASGLVRQLWKVAFQMWQHRNTWQHDEANPENRRQHLELDHQMESAFRQGTTSVLKEHQHLFLMTLADRQQLPLSEKVAWLEFVQLAQRRYRAHIGRQHETRRRFRAWARSGLPNQSPTTSPDSITQRKRSNSRSILSRTLRRQEDLRPSLGSARVSPIPVQSSATHRKRKRPPD